MPRHRIKCHILSLKTVVGQLCKPHNMKYLKHFDGLARLTLTRQIYADACNITIGNVITAFVRLYVYSRFPAGRCKSGVLLQ